jgi:hypothetical protein
VCFLSGTNIIYIQKSKAIPVTGDVRPKTSPPCVSRLSRKCEIPDVSQPRRTAEPVMGITFLYVDDVHTSQETRLWSSTACYGNSLTFLYVDDVRT